MRFQMKWEPPFPKLLLFFLSLLIIAIIYPYPFIAADICTYKKLIFYGLHIYVKSYGTLCRKAVCYLITLKHLATIHSYSKFKIILSHKT